MPNNMIKTFEEYRYFKIKSIPSYGYDLNVKDKNEPFYNKYKKEYKIKKEVERHLPNILLPYEKYLNFKKELKEKGFKGTIVDNMDHYADWKSWYINDYITCTFSYYYDYDEIIYNPRGVNKIVGKEIIKIPHLSKIKGDKDLKSIFNAILKADQEITEYNKQKEEFLKYATYPEWDPYGEDSYNEFEEKEKKWTNKKMNSGNGFQICENNKT